MVLIGCYKGEFNGNLYAKIITTEEFTKAGSRGLNAVISKASVDLVTDLIAEWELYENQKVAISYDRYGKAQSLSVIN